MKKVVLLGDSIRLGYQSTVRELLAGRAEVWSPEENGQHSTNHLLNIQEWYIAQQADVIHFNFGLWDCRRILHGHKQNLVSIDQFTRNLDVIVEAIQQHTKSQPIWATITPVIEARHRAAFPNPSEPFRVGADVELYNAASATVLTKRRVVINDLHDSITHRNPHEMIGTDGVHFTEGAYREIGAQVASSILDYL